jgi:hypothetical protein
MPLSRDIRARHEAGHVVMCLRLGVPIATVTIDEALTGEADAMGGVSLAGLASVTDLEQILIACGGGAAAPHQGIANREDWRAALRAARRLYPDWSEEEHRDLVTCLSVGVQRIIGLEQATVETLAHALLERTTMTGVEIDELMGT